MNLNEVRAAIRQVIAEEMKKGGLPKSGGKLVHLKKELAGLKKMKESLGQYQIAEGGESSSFVAEYAHMQKFVNELPVSMDKPIFIPKHVWHRTIKGTGPLKIKITKS